MVIRLTASCVEMSRDSESSVKLKGLGLLYRDRLETQRTWEKWSRDLAESQNVSEVTLD